MSAADPLETGRKLLDEMMRECKKTDSKVPFEDKLKVLDRWIKFQELEHRRKAGGMGGGFDNPQGGGDGTGDGI